jgi:hypothetical protein
MGENSFNDIGLDTNPCMRVLLHVARALPSFHFAEGIVRSGLGNRPIDTYIKVQDFSELLAMPNHPSLL